jgi:hypothetical protein
MAVSSNSRKVEAFTPRAGGAGPKLGVTVEVLESAMG